MTITIGLEEELQVVDPATFVLVPHNLEEGQRLVPDKNGTSSCEIHRCALETQTPVCNDVDSLLESVRSMRSVAIQRAHLQHQEVLAAGLHPFSDWRTQALRDDPLQYPHYTQLLHEYGDVARGAMSFGMHLHFGLPDSQYRIAVMNRLREVLPDVLALSVSSPFELGRDTGTKSWRHALLDRYPRMGVPEIWESNSQYFEHVARLRDVGVLSSNQGLWEDVRLHHKYDTIEVRICDAVPSLSRIWLIAALLLCEVTTIYAEIQTGKARLPLDAKLIAENRWRARRYGLEAQFIDWHRNVLESTPTRFIRWLDRLTPAAAQLGLLPRLQGALLSALTEGTSADYQRQLYLETGDMHEVVRHLITETAMLTKGGSL